MTLGFSTEINGKPNLFVEKIYVGLYDEGLVSISKIAELAREPLNVVPDSWKYIDTLRKAWGDYKGKIHTIRLDKHDRWKAGNMIHPVINNRTPKRFQFCPEIPCISTQYFQVLYEEGFPTVYIGNTKEDWMPFYIEDKIEGIVYGSQDMNELAINDGFDSKEDFFEYFNADFTGKLIHWTPKRYN